MTDPTQTSEIPQRLPTGETITVHDRFDGRFQHRWEAEVLVPRLPGPADRHATGRTGAEAVRRLIEYVAMLDREEDING